MQLLLESKQIILQRPCSFSRTKQDCMLKKKQYLLKRNGSAGSAGKCQVITPLMTLSVKLLTHKLEGFTMKLFWRLNERCHSLDPKLSVRLSWWIAVRDSFRFCKPPTAILHFPRMGNKVTARIHNIQDLGKCNLCFTFVDFDTLCCLNPFFLFV